MCESNGGENERGSLIKGGTMCFHVRWHGWGDVKGRIPTPISVSPWAIGRG